MNLYLKSGGGSAASSFPWFVIPEMQINKDLGFPSAWFITYMQYEPAEDSATPHLFSCFYNSKLLLVLGGSQKIHSHFGLNSLG